MSDTPSRTVSAYFDAWRAHNPSALRALLADDATFVGPLGRSENADEYAESIQRMFAITNEVQIQKMVADGEDVITWFELLQILSPRQRRSRTGAGSRTARLCRCGRPRPRAIIAARTS